MEKHLLILYCCKSPQTTKGIDRCRPRKSMKCSTYQKLKIDQILSIAIDELHIEAIPLSDIQCPICNSDQNVIRKGSNGVDRSASARVCKENLSARASHPLVLRNLRSRIWMGV